MNKKYNKGFSLIELLTVIAIIGILSSIGYYRFDKFEYILKYDTRILYTSITKARSIAVKTNKKIYVGIIGKNIDYYKDEQLIESISLKYFDIYSNLTCGVLGGKDLPNHMSCTDGTVPLYVCNACNENLISCNKFDEWLDSFNAKKYDSILIFNPTGTVNAEAMYQFKHYKTNNLMDIIDVNILGHPKVLY